MPSSPNGSKWQRYIQDLFVLDIQDLERRWLKYKIKSYAPHVLGGVLLLFIVIGTASWLFSTPKQTKKTEVSGNAGPQNISLQQNTQPIAEENTTVLEPSMGFVQTFQNNPQDTETEPVSAPKKTSTLPHASATLPPPKVLSMPDTTASAAPVVPPKQILSKGAEQSLSINRNESKLDIEELKQRFRETSNANLGLFIARYYYDRGEYTEAYNYALKTNAINNKIDDSWIVFSKSLVKLGKTEQAKKTLQLYVQQSNSESARGLLDAIEKGTFK